MSRSTLERAALVTVIAFCAALLWAAVSIRAPAHLFPIAVVSLTLGLAVLALWRALRHRDVDAMVEPGRGRIVLGGMAGLAVYIAVMSVSYSVATGFFLFAGYAFLMPDRSAPKLAFAALLAVATSGLTWLCFSVGLGVNLPG